ncbi:MAG: hypothetical protein A2W31_13220 [Planctomycetes bacterium RBG_16_64_10]|nr:MAG: hypothetical protein A2W31_13220 [Planctomycetes bacterium RBG_16_64_10]
MTPATLKSHTRKDLAQMARQRGVPGWHAMRKDELVRAILRFAKKKGALAPARRTTAGNVPAKRTRTTSAVVVGRSGKRRLASRHARARIGQLQAKLHQIKNLATASAGGKTARGKQDRLVLMVRDPYWLHACWELSAAGIERARAALGQRWHTAVPVLRLSRLGEDGAATLLRDIRIHGGVSNWYLDVQNPSSQFRLEIGYVAQDGGFHRLARSNSVTTPAPGVSEAMDNNWMDLAQNADRIFAMSGGYSPQGGCRELQEMLEERLGRPMGSPMQTRHGAGAGAANTEEFQLLVDAELVVYGATQCDAHVTLKGEPVRLRPDGTFTVRLQMPERRQVIPVVASSSDGVEQRTISIAVERNTKVMEPVIREMGR